MKIKKFILRLLLVILGLLYLSFIIYLFVYESKSTQMELFLKYWYIHMLAIIFLYVFMYMDEIFEPIWNAITNFIHKIILGKNK